SRNITMRVSSVASLTHAHLHSFPTTTLFRSAHLGDDRVEGALDRGEGRLAHHEQDLGEPEHAYQHRQQSEAARQVGVTVREAGRSEEHTSELQSRENLVCRLLLEKKKKSDRE